MTIFNTFNGSKLCLYACVTGMLGLVVSCSDSDLATSDPLTLNVNSLPRGTVTATANPLVASYTIAPGQSGAVSVEFGTDTSYGRQTWSQETVNGTATILVAGMRQNTVYHMRAVVQFADGSTSRDVDHTFTAGAFPSSLALPGLSVPTTDNPQPGIELLAADYAPSSNFLQAYAVDLQGNIIWGYTYPGQTSAIVQPIKLLSNGHMILIASFASQSVTGTGTTTTLVTLREIDLAGVTIREITLNGLNTKLAAAGYDLTLTDFHHDVTPLPNGHFLLIASIVKEYDNVSGFPGANQVVGDVVIDLDQNFNPVWIWNEFDHLDVNRHPAQFPDWTHTNALLYSKDDGNILVSIRHQSWIVKVDYQDGAGTGDIIWRLGEGGDFTLTGGTDPTDWFYGQHQPAFISANTTGVITMTMMDNGYYRVFPPGVTCGAPGSPACNYTRVPVFQIDENAKTAALLYQNTQPVSEYSLWGGGTTSLANGNLEYDLCALPKPNSIVREISLSANPTVAWELDIAGQNAYRANRIPSLYPNVQW